MSAERASENADSMDERAEELVQLQGKAMSEAQARALMRGGGTAEDLAAAQSLLAKRHQVARACLHCAQAHLSCEDPRPCDRCVRKGLECIERPRKGRPRRQEPEEPPGTAQISMLWIK